MKIMNQTVQHQNSSYTLVADQKLLFTAVTLGNESAFTEMVHTYFSKLLLIACRITKSEHAAEDIVQEAFLELWQKRAAITPNNLGGWLYKVVTIQAYKYVKRESQKLQIHHYLQAGKRQFCLDVEEHLTHKEHLKLFDKAYACLPERQRVIYRLSREKGLSRHEIANHLNISPHTVKNHLTKAVQFIKEHIGGRCLFFASFVFNNIFFNSTSTKIDLKEFYKIEQQINKKVRVEMNQFANDGSNSFMKYPLKTESLNAM